MLLQNEFQPMIAGVKGRGEKVGSYRVKWMLVRGADDNNDLGKKDGLNSPAACTLDTPVILCIIFCINISRVINSFMVNNKTKAFKRVCW